ncbi:hypothetical protein GJW-30_1_00561 [Variibacter gotjawalensis]|uniref:DUF3606 domain-containing protein n=1 Tax=Variibacter gotjawalensis TaxID=1333996 RepID=A0A0S3PQ58_9BRAD|nr:DUF3606 domain-containing protein [Variibacter gotjawalensis]NIK48346.1 hypothetical protein [Variibacter gotjawalensis]RZS50216.1 uncharacterized protein DUF3606 [Variibacter gotjawalensis]BAT58047.1 hypothetical protein GJW-30_1_00561 [Variibacter gotjawalensis]
MADRTANRDKPIRTRINVNEEQEMKHWTEALAITPKQLKSAVALVGPESNDVKRYLRDTHQ